MACAWAGFAAYGLSMVLSYFFGQKYYPINYPLRDIALYTMLAVVLFAGMQLANSVLGMWPALAANTLLILIYCAVVYQRDLKGHLHRSKK